MDHTRVNEPIKVGSYTLSIYRTESGKYISFARCEPNPLASVWTDQFNTFDEAAAMVYGWENTIVAAQENSNASLQ